MAFVEVYSDQALFSWSHPSAYQAALASLRSRLICGQIKEPFECNQYHYYQHQFEESKNTVGSAFHIIPTVFRPAPENIYFVERNPFYLTFVSWTMTKLKQYLSEGEICFDTNWKDTGLEYLRSVLRPQDQLDHNINILNQINSWSEKSLEAVCTEKNLSID